MATAYDSYLAEQAAATFGAYAPSYAAPAPSYAADPYAGYDPAYSGSDPYAYDYGYDDEYAPAPDPYDPYGYGAQYGGYEPAPPPAPTYQTTPAPYLDPGYTLDQTGYTAPVPPTSAITGQPALYQVEQPDFGLTALPSPATAPTVAPAPAPADQTYVDATTAYPERNPVMPEPAPFVPTSTDPYQTGDAYSTGTELGGLWAMYTPVERNPTAQLNQALEQKATDEAAAFAAIEADPSLAPPNIFTAIGDELTRGEGLYGALNPAHQLGVRLGHELVTGEPFAPPQPMPAPTTHHLNTAVLGGPTEQPNALASWTGDRFSDLGTWGGEVASVVAPPAATAGQALGETWNRLTAPWQSAFAPAAESVDVPAVDTERIEAFTTAGAEGALRPAVTAADAWFTPINQVDPHTPILGGLRDVGTTLVSDLEQAETLGDRAGALLGGVAGLYSKPLEWSQEQQGLWAYDVAAQNDPTWNAIWGTIGGYTSDVGPLDQAFLTPMADAAIAAPEGRQLLMDIYNNAETASPGSGPRAVWENYQANTEWWERAIRDTWSDPLTWMWVPRSGASFGAAGGRYLQSLDSRPVLNKAGRLIETGSNVVGATSGSAEAMADLGVTPLSDAFTGWAGRRLRGTPIAAPFRLTDEAQAELDVSTTLDAVGALQSTARGMGYPPGPPNQLTPLPPFAGNGRGDLTMTEPVAGSTVPPGAPQGVVPPLRDQPHPETVGHIDRTGLVQLSSDHTRQWWITRQDTGDVVAGPGTVDEIEPQLSNMHEAVRTGLQTQGATPPDAGFLTQHPIYDAQGTLRGTATRYPAPTEGRIVPPGARRTQGAGTPADAAMLPRTTTPGGAVTPPPGEGRQNLAQEAARLDDLARRVAANPTDSLDIPERTRTPGAGPEANVIDLQTRREIGQPAITGAGDLPDPFVSPATRQAQGAPGEISGGTPGEQAFPETALRREASPQTGAQTIRTGNGRVVAAPNPTTGLWEVRDVLPDGRTRFVRAAPTEAEATRQVQLQGARRLTTAELDDALTRMRTATDEEYLSPEAAAIRNAMYQRATSEGGPVLRQDPPVEPAVRENADGTFTVVNARTNSPLTSLRRTYPTRQAAEAEVRGLSRQTAGQTRAYNDFLDLQAKRLHDDPVREAAMRNPRQSRPLAEGTIQEIKRRAGIDNPLPPAPDGQAIDVQTGERVLVPTETAPGTGPLRPAPSVVEIDPNSVVVDPVNFQPRSQRYNREGLTEASVDDIVRNFDRNRLDPIKVWRRPDDGALVVISGHHRLEAAKRLNVTLPATVVEGTLEDAKRIARQSNSITTLNPTDYGRALRAEMDEGATITQAAATHKLKRTQAERYIDTSYLPGNLQELVDNGQLDLPKAARLGRAVRDGTITPADAQAFFEQQMLTNDFTATQLDHILRGLAQRKADIEAPAGMDMFAGMDLGTAQSRNIISQMATLGAKLAEAERLRRNMRGTVRGLGDSDPALTNALNAKLATVEDEITQLRTDLGQSTTFDPGANPVNRVGFTVATPRQTRQAGRLRGQGIRDRAARPSNVRQTAGQAPTDTTRYRGLPLSSEELEALNTPMAKTHNRDVTAGDVTLQYTDEVMEASILAQLSNPTQAETRRLNELASKYGRTREQFSAMTHDLDALDRAVFDKIAAEVRREFIALGKDPNAITRAIETYLNYRRNIALYNHVRVPGYIMTNLIGNTITLGLFKPSALFGRGMLWDLNNVRRIRDRMKSTPGAAFNPDRTIYGTVARSLGYKPRSSIVGVQSRDQIDYLWGMDRTTGERSLASRLLLSEEGYWIAQAVDQAMREAIAIDVMRRTLPRMVREIRAHAKQRAQDFGVLVSDAQIDAALDGLIDAAKRKPNNAGLPAFSQTQLTEALAALPTNAGPSPARWADRVARDWREATTKLMADADAEANRLAFTFRQTNLDRALSKVVMFHYWTSRASMLYITEAMKNPWMISAYFRATEGLNRMAEEGNYPDSVKGALKIFDTIGGYAGYFRPEMLFPMLIMQTERVWREDGEYGLTKFGEGIQWISDKIGLVPLWREFTYNTGMEGGGNLPPDTSGFGPIFDSLGWVANALNASGVLGQIGLEYGEHGPEQLPAPARTIDNRAAHAISGFFDNLLSRDNDLLKQVPLESEGFLQGEYELRQIVSDMIAEAEPRLSADEHALRVDEVMADTGGDLYQAAYDRWVQLDGARAGQRFISPIGSSGVALRNVANDQRGATIGAGIITDPATGERRRAADSPQDTLRLEQQTEDARTINDAVRSAGPEDAAYQADLDAYFAARDDLGHAVANDFFRILDGDVANSFKVNGRTITPEQVAAMSESQRYTLAEEWLGGISQATGADARERMDTRYDAQNAIIAENPHLAGAIEFRERADEHPGGMDQFIAETAALNKPYRDYLTTLDEPVGSEGYRDKAIGYYRAAQIVQGQATDIFNPLNSGEGQGRVAGLPEETSLTSAWHMRQAEREADQVAREAEAAEREAEFEQGSEYIQDARRDLETTGQVRDWLAANFGQADADAYMARIMGNDDAFLSDAAYDAMNDQFEYPWPREGAREYLVWANQQPANVDVSFDAWRAADRAAYEAEQARLEANPEAAFDPATLVGRSSAAPAPTNAAPGLDVTGLAQAAMTGQPPPDGVELGIPDGGRSPTGAPAGYGGGPLTHAILGGAPTTTDYGFKAPTTLPFYGYFAGHGGSPTEHTGIDAMGTRGQPMYAPMGGTVTCGGTDHGGGSWGTGCAKFNDDLGGAGRIEVMLDDGSSLVLGHAETSAVQPGDRVTPGQVVGTMGTGNGADHVHIERRIWRDDLGTYWLIDPETGL